MNRRSNSSSSSSKTKPPFSRLPDQSPPLISRFLLPTGTSSSSSYNKETSLFRKQPSHRIAHSRIYDPRAHPERCPPTSRQPQRLNFAFAPTRTSPVSDQLCVRADCLSVLWPSLGGDMFAVSRDYQANNTLPVSVNHILVSSRTCSIGHHGQHRP